MPSDADLATGSLLLVIFLALYGVGYLLFAVGFLIKEWVINRRR